jgi:ATP-dependent Lon protease
VCQRDIEGPITARANDVIRPHLHVINTPVPLVACPDLRPVRTALVQEFPYAEAVVDFLLAGLVGRPHVRFEPLLLVGEPGGGKTRFVRRACELLNVGVARIDATQADGSACAGTDKRWSTASPSAPFLAISRFQHGNPVLLVDEIDKAATRSDYGRLWDVLVSLCERENTTRYPDPGLGSEVDISHASYIATANATSMLPAPLLDRFRRVEFPQPRVQDLDVLVHSFRHEIATDRGLDPRFFPPLAPAERRLVLKQWGGGSVRRLRRLCEVVFRSREKLFLVQ